MRAIVLAAAVIGLVAAALGPAAFGAGDVVSITLPPEQVTLAPGPGMDVTATQCRMCHSLDYITTQPRGSAAQWQGVVTKMVKVFGAPISETDATAIAEYLARAYGPAR